MRSLTLSETIMDKGKAAEQFVDEVLNTAYIKHWCYPGPIDEHGSKKEICDNLILFANKCIIVSVKNYNLNGKIDRFHKKVIDKSSRQLYGAERKLFGSKNLYIKHPDRKAEQFEPERYTEIHRITVNMGELYNNVQLADITSGKGIVHIIHRDSFTQLIAELNTVTDLANYLSKREELMLSGVGIIIQGHELDLLANYLSEPYEFPDDWKTHDNVLELDLRGNWDHYNRGNTVTDAQREIDRLSYAIDRLVERDILKDDGAYEVATHLMNLTREQRSLVMASLHNLVEKYGSQPDVWARRSFVMGTTLYLLFTYPNSATLQQSDRFISDALGIYMHKANYEPDQVVAIGTTYDLGQSKYGIAINTHDVNEEGRQAMDELCNQYGWFQNMERIQVPTSDYPNRNIN